MNQLSRFLLLSGVLTALLPLANCATEPGVNQQTTMIMQHDLSQPYTVNVSNIVIENKYDPLLSSKDVSSTMATPLDVSLKDYAEKRFRPAGTNGTLHFVIRDAALFRDHKDSPIKVGKALGVGDQDRYTAVVKVGLVRETTAASIGAMGAELKAERSATMPASVSLNERDARLQELTLDVLKDIDQAATDSLTNAMKLSAPDLAPSPGAFPAGEVERIPQTN